MSNLQSTTLSSLVEELRRLRRENRTLSSSENEMRCRYNRLGYRLTAKAYSKIDRIPGGTKVLRHAAKGARRVVRVLRDGPPVFVRNSAWPVDQPLVSVIVPAFNYGEFLPAAIKSLLSQTWSDLEVIVIDGGSTDGVTPNLVRAQEGTNVRVVIQKERTTVGADRNLGLSMARGKYALCMDADDMVDPTYIEKALILLETAGLDVVTPWVKLFDKQEGSQFDFSGQDNSWMTVGPVLPDILLGNYCSTVALFRLSFWRDNNIGYFSERRHFEDWDFWIRFASHGARFTAIQEFLHLYRIHGKSLTDSLGETREIQTKMIQDRWESFRKDESRVAQAIKKQNQPVWVSNPLINLWGRFRPQANESRILICVPHLAQDERSAFLSVLCGKLKEKGVVFSVTSMVRCHEPHSYEGCSIYQQFSDDVSQIGFYDERFRGRAFEKLLDTRKPFQVWLIGGPIQNPLRKIINAKKSTVKFVRVMLDAEDPVLHDPELASWINSDIVSSPSLKRKILQKEGGPRKINVIKLVGNVGAFRQSVFKNPSALRFGFFGNLEENERPEDLIKILKRFKDMSALIAGNGPLKPDLIALAMELGVSDRIQWGNAFDLELFSEQIQAAVFPGAIRGLALPLLHCMGKGIPCLVGRTELAEEIIKSDVNGFLFEAGDLDDFEKAIQKLKDLNALKLTELGKAARNTILTKFSAESAACDLLPFLDVNLPTQARNKTKSFRSSNNKEPVRGAVESSQIHERA